MVKRKLIPILLLFSLLLSFVAGCTKQTASSSEQGVVSVSNEETKSEAEDNEGDALTSATSQSEKEADEDVEDSLEENEPQANQENTLKEGEAYSSKEEVALYLFHFKTLPSNFITKKEAKRLGWIAKEGNLWEVTNHMSIGGDVFGNREGKLPDKKGRTWYECDIDYQGGTRGPKRIVYSNDGWIYYTGDHYSTFELLYEGD
ncbi:ribonuclease domain-containing protein [Filifactor villosus]|uniref:Ribonuclease n=1 Tax=Filifactor villosus TaxID=29374 RepID=A0ABV9QK75_9FIRM